MAWGVRNRSGDLRPVDPPQLVPIKEAVSHANPAALDVLRQAIDNVESLGTDKPVPSSSNKLISRISVTDFQPSQIVINEALGG